MLFLVNVIVLASWSTFGSYLPSEKAAAEISKQVRYVEFNGTSCNCGDRFTFIMILGLINLVLKHMFYKRNMQTI